MSLRIVPPDQSDNLAAILAKPDTRNDYMEACIAALDAHREREEVFDRMRALLRQAAFIVDSTRLIFTDPASLELAKQIAQEYRDLADKADACAVTAHAAEGETCSERR